MEQIRSGFQIKSLTLCDSSTGQVFWNISGEDLFMSGTASIKKAVLDVDEITREIVFSSTEQIKDFQIEQSVLFRNQEIENWSFRFGFVIPGSTNTWQQKICGSPNRMKPEQLNGNLEILTSFLDGKNLIKRSSVIIYYIDCPFFLYAILFIVSLILMLRCHYLICSSDPPWFEFSLPV